VIKLEVFIANKGNLLRLHVSLATICCKLTLGDAVDCFYGRNGMRAR